MADGTLRSAKDGLCALCYAKATDKCAKCKARWYCSPFCQQKDWKLGHKGNCGLEDLPQATVPEPPHRLLPESVSRPVISDSAWRRLQELDAGPRKGPARGLRNLGNSCYMNSVLQGLFHGSPLLLNACREHWASCGGPIAGGCSAGGPRAAINGSTGCFRCDLQAATQICLDPLGHEGSADNGEEVEFAAGDRVLLQGLSQEELNGQEGLVVSPPSYTAATSSSSGELRCGVRLAGLSQTKAIKPQNLALHCRAAVGPSDVVRWLPRLHSDFTFGMQEDAHEFLRSVLRLVEDEELKDHAEVLRRGAAEDSGGATSSSAPAPNADLTASPSRIFGGLLASQCTCTNRSCCASSFSFETFQDLSLDVTEVTDSIEDALRLYTAPERLDKKNGWRCEVCAEVVRARKQITIYTAPSFLVLHLKRFRYETHGKVTRPVEFQSKLNLRPFLCAGSPEAAGSLMYDLRVVVVHLDKAGFSHFGHYVAYVRCLPSEGAGGVARWWLLDDSQAVEVTEAEVLSQQAYLLLYSRASASAPEAPPILQRGRSGAEAGAAGGESLPSKCRGRGGAVCSFFAGHDGLCTKCYQEEYGREPPAAPAPTPSPAPQPAPAAPKAKASPAPTAKVAAAKAAPAAGAAGSGRVKKVGANEQCPCGSGKKYKKCHGAA